jgi:hypothetical protein
MTQSAFSHDSRNAPRAKGVWDMMIPRRWGGASREPFELIWGYAGGASATFWNPATSGEAMLGSDDAATRVLKWIVERMEGQAQPSIHRSVRTVPTSLDVDGLNLPSICRSAESSAAATGNRPYP